VLGRMYRASVSSVFRHGTIWFRHLRLGFVICGSTAAGVSSFVAAIRPWFFVPVLFLRVADL
jgi:hypothetical protein